MYEIEYRDNCNIVRTDGEIDFYLGAGNGLCESLADGSHIVLGNLEHQTIRGLPCLTDTSQKIHIWLPLGGETYLRTYLSPPYFWENLDLRIEYHEVGIGTSFEVAGWVVTPKMLSKHGWNYGFRFDKENTAFASLPREDTDDEFSKGCQIVIDETFNGCVQW